MVVEKLENSFINRPECFELDQIERYKENPRQFCRLSLLDHKFTNGMLYKELYKLEPKLSSKAFRFNILNVFINLFNTSTIERFFDISPYATVDGVFRGMLFLIKSSFNQMYYPLKTTLLEYILHEIVCNKYPSDLVAGWQEIRLLIIDCFDEEEYREYFEERKEKLHQVEIKMQIH